MKITILMGPFQEIPPFSTGAVEKIWFSLANEFACKGINVQIIAKKPKVCDVNYYNNVNVNFITGFNRTGFLVFDLILDFIYSINGLLRVGKTDILIMNTFSSVFLQKIFINNSVIKAYNVARYPKGQYKFYPKIERYYCVSRDIQNALVKENSKLFSACVVINNPVDTEVFYFRKRLNEQSLKIVYAGRIHPEKGIDILVKAWQIVLEMYDYVQLELIGPIEIKGGGGGKEYKGYLDSLVKKSQILWKKAVVDTSLLSDCYGEANIFCYPSVAENGESFGVAPLEAMSTGAATIVSDLNCFKDFIDDGINGVIFNHRYESCEKELSSKIIYMINNYEFRVGLGLNGSLRAKDFSINHIASEYLADFKYLIENKHG